MRGGEEVKTDKAREVGQRQVQTKITQQGRGRKVAAKVRAIEQIQD